ncbi:NUDIX domain-containing protein [bacterium]|nr:NUDIX domain-containing protein [bacterium]
MNEIIQKLHKAKEYRPVVVAIIINKNGEFLLVQSAKGNNPWLFPQGGIESNEDPAEALFREVEEETGIKSSELTILQDNVYYQELDAPPDRKNKRGFENGKAYFYIYCTYRGDGSLTLQEEEIISYKWVNKDDLIILLTQGRSTKMKMTLKALSYVKDLDWI